MAHPGQEPRSTGTPRAPTPMAAQAPWDTRPPSSCPVRLLAPWSSVQHVSPHLRGMVEGCGQDHGDGLLLMPQGSTQPSLPAAPGTPDAAAVAFSHGLTARV